VSVILFSIMLRRLMTGVVTLPGGVWMITARSSKGEFFPGKVNFSHRDRVFSHKVPVSGEK